MKSRLKAFQFLALAIIASAFPTLKASAMVDPDATQETKDLYALLQTLNSEDGAAFGNEYAMFRGIYADGTPWYFTDADGEYLGSDIQNISGVHPSVSGWDLNEFAMTTGDWCDANIDSIIKSSEMGVICTLSFHENNPVTGGIYNDTNINLDDIMPNGSYHAAFEAQWSKAADAIARMVRSDGTMVPVLLRPFHENNGSWFWWGSKNDTAKFIQLYQWVVTYLRDTRGLHNIIYVYNTDKVSSESEYLARWPGDDYVDVVSCDVYMSDTDSASTLTTPLGIVIKVAEAKGKPAALAEVGSSCTGGMYGTSLTNWWTTKVLEPLRDADMFRHIAYIAGWASWSASQCYIPYLGEKNSADFKTFLQSDEIFLLDHLNPDAVWTKHARLGWINTVNYPWVYSFNQGWEYMYNVFNPDDDSDWLYDFKLGWLWTDDHFYPYIWSSGKGYLYYSNTTEAGLRWFYCYDEGKLISVPLSQ